MNTYSHAFAPQRVNPAAEELLLLGQRMSGATTKQEKLLLQRSENEYFFHSITLRVRLLSQLAGKSLQIKPAHLPRQACKRLHDPLEIFSPILVRLKIAISVHVPTRRIDTGLLEAAEEDIDRDAQIFGRRRRVEPERRDVQDVTRCEDGFVRMAVLEGGVLVGSVGVEDIDG